MMETAAQRRQPASPQRRPHPAGKAGGSPRTPQPLIAGVGTLLLALGIGVLIGRSGNQGSAPTAAAPQIIEVGGGEASTATASAGGSSAGSAKKKSGDSTEAKAKSKTGANGQTAAAEEVLKPAAGTKLPPPVVKPGTKAAALASTKNTNSPATSSANEPEGKATAMALTDRFGGRARARRGRANGAAPQAAPGATSQPAAAAVPPAATAKPEPATERTELVVDLERRRDQLTARVAELQWDLGGLVYEMAIRNRINVEVLVKRAVALQDADAELSEVERIVRMEETGTAGSCGSCAAPHSNGATFCWQCGQPLLEQVSSDAILRG